MPSGARMSWYERRCSRSLSAITPSKSNTIACRSARARSRRHGMARIRLVHFLAGANRHGEPVLLRRERAVVLWAVVAVGVVGDVEVDDVDAGRSRIELHVSAGRIGVGAAGRVGERHEQAVDIAGFQIAERRQPHRLPLQRELQRADALEVADLADRRRHLDARAIFRRLERGGDGVVFVDRKVGQRQKRGLLVRRNR